MAYGEHQEHEAPPTVELNDLKWNTQVKIREHFGYPTDPEFFGEWLLWFYDGLNVDQRRTLRYSPLSEIDVSDYPPIPSH